MISDETIKKLEKYECDGQISLPIDILTGGNMEKEKAVEMIREMGYQASIDSYGIVMVQLTGENRQKEFNALRSEIREAGYTGSIGYGA